MSEDSNILGQIVFYTIVGLGWLLLFSTGLGFIAWLAKGNNPLE